MYILCTQYDSGHIARVVNPDAIPNRRARYGILCGGFTDDGAQHGGEPVVISWAQRLPRRWRGYCPGYRGDEVWYDAANDVFRDDVYNAPRDVRAAMKTVW